MSNPYESQPPQAFWRNCREDPGFLSEKIFAPKFGLGPKDRIATAGSCFAQHIGRHLRQSGLELMDAEPVPRNIPEQVARDFGYLQYSARYGNIYTVRQLYQLVDDAFSERVRSAAILSDENGFYDGLRPGVEPAPFATAAEVKALRRDHLRRVGRMLEELDVLIFTMGLTECWMDEASGTVFPTCPGTVVGEFDPKAYVFQNFGVAEVLTDLIDVIELIRSRNARARVILTVSPVPLTATAGKAHVLAASTLSKSVLRAVAGEVCSMDERVDYFPSFELATGLPFGNSRFSSNLRTVTPDAVSAIMARFLESYGHAPPDMTAPTPQTTLPSAAAEDDLACEEHLLEAFARK